MPCVKFLIDMLCNDMMLLFNKCHPNLLKKYKMIFNHREVIEIVSRLL